jgi:superfamily II helicase
LPIKHESILDGAFRYNLLKRARANERIEHSSDASFPGDLINWLDQTVRYVEAIEAVARVLGKGEAAKEARERKKRVEGE